MKPEEMKTLLQRRPFQPLRVHLTDGRVLDILYPEINLITPGSIVIGIPPAVVSDPWPRAERAAFLDWSNIERVETLPVVPAAP